MNPVVALPLYLVRAEPAAVARAVSLVSHHSLSEEAFERFGETDLAQPLQRPSPEPRVEQMQDRMLDPANILGDWKPRLRFGAIERLVRRLACEADEIPARIGEGVESVSLACPRSAAARTIDVLPGRVPVERVAGLIELDVLGKHDWKLVARNGN